MMNALRLLAPLALTAALFIVGGCGRKPAADPSATVATPAGHSTAKSSGKRADRKADKGKGQAAGKANSQLGNIPLDVWFDDPIGESQKQGTVAPAKAETTVAKTAAKAAKPASEMAEEPATAAAAPAAGVDDWKSIIPAETIQDETKKIRLRLADGLQSVVKYNAHYKEIPVDGAVLAAMAGIMIVHPESVSWKAKANHVRDLASTMADKSKGLGAKPFEETQKAYEKLDQLLNGNVPGDLPEAAPELPFNEVAKRAALMNRMQLAIDWMKSNVTTDAALKKEAEKAVHEASLIAALGKVISASGYPSSDEAEYQGFVKDLIQANLDVVNAAKGDDLKAFNEAKSRSDKACANCHLAYRFEDGN